MSNWSSLGPGLNNLLRDMVFAGPDLYAGGFFTNTGDSLTPLSYIAKWDGATWSALGTGMSGPVTSLAWDGANLYAGGQFTTAGGVSVSNIAKWDGVKTWSALGAGIGPISVQTLAWDGANLYVGGDFTVAGGLAANNVAKWDGVAWSVLGGGTNGIVATLACIGGDLYAVGYFTTAGGVTVNGIARWNGTAWTALGTGINGFLVALAWDGTNLYCGGQFTTAGGVPANCIAKWNGTAWSALGTGMNASVDRLLWNDGTLYASGHFTTAGGITANRVARWDGATWKSVEYGFNLHILAMAFNDPMLYVGGYFSTTGEIPPRTILITAQWDSTPEYLTITGVADGCEGVGTELTAQSSDPTASHYQWYLDGVIIPGAVLTTYAAMTSGDYMISATIYSETITSPAFNVAIYSNPTPMIESVPKGIYTVCEELTVTLDAGDYEAYSWSRSGILFTPPFSSSRTVDVGVGVYAVGVTDSNGCTGSSTEYSITRLNLPEPEIVSDPVDSHFVCSGSKLTLDAGKDFVAYEWFESGSPVSFSSSQTVNVGVGTYTVIVTNKDGCRALSPEYLIEDFNITLSSSIGSDGVVTLVANCPELFAHVGQWYLDGDEIDGATGLSWTVATPGIYTFSHVITGATCWSDNSIAVIRSTAVCTLTMVYPADGVVIESDSPVIFDISDDVMDPITIDYINLQVFSDAASPGTYVLIPEITIGSAYVTYVKIANGWRITINGYTFTPDSNLKIQASIIIP